MNREMETLTLERQRPKLRVVSDHRILDELEEFAAQQEHELMFEELLDDVNDEEQASDETAAAADDDDEDDDFGPQVLSPFSQDAMACSLGRSGWDKDARYIDEWGQWAFWNGNTFEIDKKKKAYTLIREFIRAEVKRLVAEAPDDKSRAAAIKNGKECLSKAGIAAVESLAQSNPASASLVDDFDKDIFLLGTPGGIVDLKTGEMRRGDRSDMISKTTSITPAAPGALPLRFIAFLNDVFEGDQEVISFIQRYIGYSLTGSVEEHKIVFLFGEGRNGKGVLLNLIFSLLGEYARRIPIETLLKKLSGHPTDLAGLAGARYVVGSEVPTGTTWNEAIIKDITGGDVITARKMRQDYFDYIPQFSMFLHGNEQPAFRSVGVSIRERMILVPFNRTFTEDERNTHLQRDLFELEGPEILRWAIDGAVEWAKRSESGKSGLDVPAKLKAESQEYFDREDEMGQFLEDTMVVEKSAFISGDELFAKFKNWNGQRDGEHMSKRDVMKEMRKRGFKDDRRSSERGLRGLRAMTGQDRADAAANEEGGMAA